MYQRRLASHFQIESFWEKEFIRVGWSEAFDLYGFETCFDEPMCYACGWMPPIPDTLTMKVTRKLASSWLDRAHLHDRSLGGSDEANNLVPMCHWCHRSMPPSDSREFALEWIKSKSPFLANVKKNNRIEFSLFHHFTDQMCFKNMETLPDGSWVYSDTLAIRGSYARSDDLIDRFVVASSYMKKGDPMYKMVDVLDDYVKSNRYEF